MSLEEMSQILIGGERDLIKNKLDLEDAVREEMLNIFDNVIKSHDIHNSGMKDLARTVAFTVDKTGSLEATKAVCQPLFCDDKSRVKEYTSMVLNIYHREQFKDPELTTKLGETFERYINLNPTINEWFWIMINAYTKNSGIEERVMTQIDFNSQLPVDQQNRVINFIRDTINKFNDKKNLNDRETLNSVFRTLEAYHQSPLYSEIIETLEFMVPWHKSSSAMKDVANCLYRYKNSPYLRDMAGAIRESKDKTHSVKLANLFMNCSDHHNLNTDNLNCYFSYVRSGIYIGDLADNLPLRTINNLVETYNLVLSFFPRDPSRASAYLIRKDVKDVFFGVLNKKVELGETNQEKIQILDQWSTNVVRMMRDNPEKLNYNAMQMVA